MVSVACLAGALVLGLCMGSSTSWAGARDRECIQAERDDYKLCKQTCREEFRAEKILCWGGDDDCSEACRLALTACLEAPLSQLDGCRATCRTTLQEAKQACRDQYPEDPDGLAQCITNARLDAFWCRERCREGVYDALKACRQAAKACIDDCIAASGEE
jgi:hypothetical protein